MAISVQANTAQPLPQSAAQTLAQGLRSGSVVEARVVGSGTNGTTQVAIGGQLVDAALAVRLQPGTLIQLLVQGSGQSARLTVLLQTTPTPTPIPAQGQAPSTPSPSSNGPQAVQPPTVPVQSLPPSTSQASQAAPQAPQANANTPSALPQSQTANNGSQTSIQAAASNARLTLVSTPATPATSATPTTVGVPAQGAAVQPQTGQSTLQGIVVAAQGQGNLTVANSQTSVSSQIAPGTILRVQIQGSGANARPVLVPVAGGAVAKSQGQTPPLQTLPNLVPNPLQQVLVQTVQQSVARQDSIATLLTSLAGFGVKLTDLPKPVALAGGELLSGRLNLNTRPLDGAGLKAALTRSGVLFEGALQKGSAQPLPQGDLKGALLNLRNVLRNWLGNNSTGKTASQQSAPPPPPTPHTHPRAGRPVSLPLTPTAPNADTPARLLGQNEAALSRMRLVQISSLPDAAMRPGQGPAGTAPEMNIELPLIFGGELSIGQFQIFKDGSGGEDADPNGEWKMRFSINFSQIGEVGATVSLRGGKTGVMLWAEREETAKVLEEMSGELADTLLARGLEPGAIRCRHGHPPQAQKPVGAFMDNSS